MERLKNKVALITGSAAGMGAEHARLFVEEGAKVVLTDVNASAGHQLAAELGENALFLQHNVSDPDSWGQVVDAASRKFGTITVLVNNAGVAGPAAFTADLDPSAYDQVVRVDQNGVYLGMRAVIPGMVKAGGGSIVNISSAAAMVHLVGVPNMAYTGAKSAVRGMTKATAAEYAIDNVRVNSVHPGMILTAMSRETVSDQQLEEFRKILPMGRPADAREVSYAVLFLASDEASYITGSELAVDGGRLAAGR